MGAAADLGTKPEGESLDSIVGAHPAVRRRRRALVVVLSVATVIWLVIAVGLAGSGPFSAAVVSIASNGQPGFVEAPPVKGTHVNSCQQACFQPALVVPGPLVYRSPSSLGSQKVLIRYVVLHQGVLGWAATISEDQYYDIAAGQPSVRAFEKSWHLNSGGRFRVLLIVAFTDDAGAQLGSQAVLYDQQTDYICETRYPCQTGPGWVGIWQP